MIATFYDWVKYGWGSWTRLKVPESLLFYLRMVARWCSVVKTCRMFHNWSMGNSRITRRFYPKVTKPEQSLTRVTCLKSANRPHNKTEHSAGFGDGLACQSNGTL